MADDLENNVNLENNEGDSGETAASSALIGNEEWGDLTWHSQAYLATHDSSGERLPDMHRSFISFKYDGKYIEDFNIIEVTGGDRYSRGLYASFNPLVSESEVVDGQYYWGHKYNPYELTFTLATDGMLEREIQDFRNHFKPGPPKELILAEAPNRIGYARVAAEPQMAMLPFEYQITKTIAGQTITTSTTMWKGEITLSFILDDPFWYAYDSYFTSIDTNNFKIYLEDGIPYSSIFSFSDDSSAKVLLANTCTYTSSGISSEFTTSISSETDNLYLYNCGTAPAKPIIQFTFTPEFDEDNYISFPNNSYSTITSATCNYIAVDNNTFLFTTPSILTGYNQAVKILSEFQVNDSAIELYEAFRDTISEYYIRGRACSFVNSYIGSSEDAALPETFQDDIIADMQAAFSDSDGIYPITATFNSKNGIATIATHFNARDINSSTAPEQEIIENAGDMVLSNYLLLDQRTLPDNGDIISAENCLKVTTDATLSNFSINYEYTYL